MTMEQLERDVAELKVQVAALLARQSPNPAEPKDDWLSAVLGRFKGDAEFGAVVEAGRAFRGTGGFADDAPREEPS
ncbi:MAG: hypothetical protein MUF18_18155 [Fimbriiglobus sp.]|jgi:hypothetical protein|nr:hypothetical protein [Fimbriiglobus sp.]